MKLTTVIKPIDGNPADNRINKNGELEIEASGCMNSIIDF
jgi:hypothetical protein